MAFPAYKTTGLLVKEPVRDGWEDRGEVSKHLFVNDKGENAWSHQTCALCNTPAHVGRERGAPFLFCPKCLTTMPGQSEAEKRGEKTKAKKPSRRR